MPAKRAPTEESIKQENDTTAAEAALKARLSRKRTKTGCLTCRKRRIKCDEERPMCKNCNKSRRLCEGYIQRVVFKTPAFDYTGSTSAAPPSTTLQHASESIAIPGILYQPAPASAFHLHQPTYAPFLPTTQAGTGVNGADHFYPPHQQAYRQLAVHTQRETQFIMVHPAVVHTLPPTAPATLALGSQSISSSTYHTEHVEYPARFTLSPLSASTTATYGPSLVVASTQAPITVSSAVQDLQTAWQTPFDPRNAMPLPSHLRSSSSNSTSLDFTADDFVHSAYLPDSGPTQLLRNAAVETQDDDYYDVDSDDGMNAGPGPHHADHVFSTMIQRQNTTQLKSLRSYDAFLHQGMLDTYRPERVASPLRNETTARVYMHFITATGPSLSPFERSTARSGNAANTPFTQRGIWTHTMPMAALHNQGLLHAMLALASLHIARLQGGSVTPSLQHYAWSLKRIHNVVANPKKRLQLTTIAASMLLGFYEIMTAEHSKWNTHLAGAKQLIMETDFAGMMRQFTVMKRERRIRVQYETAYLAMPPTPKSLEDESLDQIHDIDERIVSRFYGQEIRYDEQGHVEVWTGSIPRLDLGKLEIMKDLFWWYCKQDCYQSIISGNPLLMDYSRWSACPPRAPLGRPDAIYGSFDHLTLLLGRVASFASKDRVRKLKVMEQNGGQWLPHPASHMARAAPPTTAPGQPPPIAPIFYGMAPPPTSKVRMPMSYERLDGKHSPNLEQESWSLEKALQEYEAIRAALDDFKSYLGEGFAPLSDDHHPPVYTSFGSTLFYLSYDIGCMMAIWNMTVIIAIRSHPHYHPAAHVAAGMAIAETAPYATDIGRIAAGIVPGPQQLPLNPFLGASLIESCMPSFFAAVQYQQPEQRHETVMRIFNIARCTGWGTADLIANGCETAWVKAAQAGRGPPYARLVRSQLHDSNDARMNGSWETQDPSVQPDENDEVDRRFIRSSNAAKLFWAVGVVGTEHDM